MSELFVNSSDCFYFPQVNCEWGTWSSSTACTKTCGGGKQLRFRTILKYGENGGTMCSDGDNFEETDCNTASCPPPGEFIRNISIAPMFSDNIRIGNDANLVFVQFTFSRL